VRVIMHPAARVVTLAVAGVIAIVATSGWRPVIAPSDRLAPLMWVRDAHGACEVLRPRWGRVVAPDSQMLASARDAVTTRLGLAASADCPRIVVAPSLAAAAQLNGGSAVPGMFNATGEIVIVGPLMNHVLLRHELTHAMLRTAWGAPHASSGWLDEGLATVAAGGCAGFSARSVAAVLSRRRQLPDLTRLLNDFRSLPNFESYLASGSVVEWLETSGRASLLRTAWRDGTHALGDPKAMQTEWIAFLEAAPKIPWNPTDGCVSAAQSIVG